MLRLFFIFLFFLCLYSCGEGFEEIKKYTSINFPNTQFYATIKATQDYSGWAKVRSLDSQLLVKIKLLGPPSDHKFLQVLHQKQFCPSLMARENLMFSDLHETESRFGSVVFIFDSRLNHQLDHLEYLPMIRGRGFYHYYRAADINILNRLGLDEFVSFKLEKTILIIYKFDPDNHYFQPVACGKFVSA